MWPKMRLAIFEIDENHISRGVLFSPKRSFLTSKQPILEDFKHWS